MHGIGAAGERTWAAPEITGVNRIPMRSPLVPFPDAETACAEDRAASPWFASLDGTWRFRLVDRPEDAPADFAHPRHDDGDWARIVVPGPWVTQGFDRPHYTNVFMPFAGRPPEVPDENPTGLYRTAFHVPGDWAGRRIVLHVGGAESVLYVYVNGAPVGLSKDSRLPAEFDITPYVRAGRENLLACMVVRWSDASYVEDQDDWWMAGIEREVFLYATAPTHIADVAVRAGLDDALRRGTLDVRVLVGFADPTEIGPWRVDVRLEHLDGTAALAKPLVSDVAHDTRPYLFPGHRAKVSATVPKVRPWSAESPQLYRLIVSLVDPSGATREVVTQRVGFRRVEVRDRRLLVNGAPVYLHGVNRHDHHPVTGKTVTVDDMRADLVAMKRFNFNAVRCSHYPNDARFYDLCDELGMYVIDEANIEAHAFNMSLCNDPRYLAAFVDRGTRMVQRDKNHACIIAWSLGNESGYGTNHDAMAAWIRRYDPTRPLHYEGAIMWDLHAAAPVSDIVCPMYPEIEQIVEWSRNAAQRARKQGTRGDRPLIMCEYSHAMGNSNGSLADYWDAIESHEGLQGGFIWEWKDHGLVSRTADGTEFWAYGGQFGDEPNDANFVADGMVWPDTTPHPAMWEHKWVARPVAVEATAAELRRGEVRVRNKQWFTDLSWLVAGFEVTVDGAVVQEGTFRLPRVAPQEHEAVTIPFERPILAAGQEAHLLVRFSTAHDLPWAPQGHEVAWDQFALRSRPGPRTPPPWNAETKVHLLRDGAGDLTPIDAGPLHIEVDKATGTIASLRWKGIDVLDSPPRFELWRGPIDNDGIKAFVGRPDKAQWVDLASKPLGRWLSWGLDDLHRAPGGASFKRQGGGVVITRAVKGWGTDPARKVTHRQRIIVLPTADVVFDESIEVPAAWDDLPRVGVSFVLPAGFDRLQWLGLGPHENYPDRRASAVVGWWESTVDEQHVPYMVPQENGGHGATRWFSLEQTGVRTDPVGILVAPVEMDDLQFTASHHTPADLFAARDVTELRRRDEVVVHVDAAHRGLGTGSCGPDTLPRWRVGAGTHRWRWRLRAYTVGEDDPATLARQVVL